MVQRRNVAAVEGAKIERRKEECVLGMGQSSNYAAVTDARITLRKEESALSMEQRSSYATVKDVQIKLSKEECASSMELRSRTEEDAALIDARIKLREEACAKGMDQRQNYAAVKDVQIKPVGGVCKRHGGKRTLNDESTAFESKFDETAATLNLPHQSADGALEERRPVVPGEVVICQEIVKV